MALPAFALYIGAAIAEIAGCFAFWIWWKKGASALWLAPGLAALVAFAFLLALTRPIRQGALSRPMAASIPALPWPGSGWLGAKRRAPPT